MPAPSARTEEPVHHARDTRHDYLLGTRVPPRGVFQPQRKTGEVPRCDLPSRALPASGAQLPANGVIRLATFVASAELAPVPAKWVILGDLDQDDAHAVRV